MTTTTTCEKDDRAASARPSRLQEDARQAAGRDQPQFVDLAQAAQTLGLSRATIKRLVLTGVIEAYRFSPRSFRIEKTALDNYRRECRIPRPAA